MKNCRFCGTPMEDDVMVCPNCGGTQMTITQPEPAPEGKKNLGLLIGLGAGAVVLVLIIVAVLVIPKIKNKNKPEPDPETGSVTVSGDETTGDDAPVPATQAYSFVTDDNGANVTVEVTDDNGDTHYYYQAIDPSATNAAGEPDPVPATVTVAQDDPAVAPAAPTSPSSGKNPTGAARTTAPAKTTAPSGADPTRPTSPSSGKGDDVVKNTMDILKSGTFALVGTMTTAGESLPMTMIKRGNDLRMASQFQDINIEIIVIGEKTYLISNQYKAYVEMTEAMRESLGMDAEMFDFGEFGFDFNLSSDQMEQGTAAYKGKQVKTYTAAVSDSTMVFFVDGSKVVKIEIGDGTDADSVIEINELRANVTDADFAIPEGYTQQSYVEFFANMMS